VLRIGRDRTLAATEYRQRILIGRDTRISGSMLLHTLVNGLLAEGEQVFDLGQITTPGVATLTRQNGAGIGIVISASHNPYEQNGIKLFGQDGFKLSDAAEEAIESLIVEMDLHLPPAWKGNYTDAGHVRTAYIEHLASHIGDAPPGEFRVVLDCANGAASMIAPEAFRRAGAQTQTMNSEPDGYNINVNAGSEHVRRDRAALLKAIHEHRADLGMAFDGDADRVVFVTPEGMLVDGDHVLGILALELRRQGKLAGDTVVATDMSNSGLEHFLAEHGIKLVRTKVGDRYVMDRMRQGGFTLGGEQAGHVIILDGALTTGDGIYVGLLVASLAARNKREGGPTLHELASRIPRYPQVIASAHLNRHVETAQVPGLADLQTETLALFQKKGRVNIRFSGTEPNLLRVMVEGGPQTTMEQVVERALALCVLVAEDAETQTPRIDLVDCATGAPIMQPGS
jgi:phosphoglucosamine mutase